MRFERKPEEAVFDRSLDLGCGCALTSMFVAKETDAKSGLRPDTRRNENYLLISG